MSPPLKPDGRSPKDDNDEPTYRLSKPSPISSEGFTPSPAVKDYTQKRPNRQRISGSGTLVGFNALVFVTSVCVMTLELTASRLIAKHVGSSLYTWTSVIGVVLAGITLGNWLGGWMADRYDRGRALGWMYLLGSLSCGGVLWLDQLVATIPRPDSMSWPQWVVTVVATIFLLPALALGATSPLVASMAIDRSAKIGSAVGNVYAWGALGSIVGTFLTGFYLIDVWGTRSIIGLTAATLAILAAIVSGSRVAFRIGVMLGWLQLLGWIMLAATSNADAFAAVGRTTANCLSVIQPKADTAAFEVKCVDLSRNFGAKLHEIGLLLCLRDDPLNQFHDESNYSDITVNESEMDGRSVKSLRLDKLIHSYYDPQDPTALHYEYERIYAAVTKKVAWGTSSEPLFLSLDGLVGANVEPRKLPLGVVIDRDNKSIRIEHPTSDCFKKLLALAPESSYWSALEQLRQETNKQSWKGFSSVKLWGIPDGTVISDEIAKTLRYDETLGALIAYQPISDQIFLQLIEDTQSGKWYQQIDALRHRSGQSTACFYGGGGFIFPRWFLQEFPASPRIDVAELDPAVYEVVKTRLGMTEEQDRKIHTTIGDARNFVDDRLRENIQSKRRNEIPVTYDFIYGDAFNDFSIPWHLTTYEFLQKTHDLLSDRGVFQANIIDIYPRTEFPGEPTGKAEVDYKGRLPNGVVSQEIRRDVYVPAAREFAPLEVMQILTNQYRLRVNRAVNERENELFKDVTWPAVPPSREYDVTKGVQPEIDVTVERDNWRTAIDHLSSRSIAPQAFTGMIPKELRVTGGSLENWQSGSPPYEFVEALNLGDEKYVLGFRGLVSNEVAQKLINLDPPNADWEHAVKRAAAKSRLQGAGQFLGYYVATAARVFPNIYLFSTSQQQPHQNRDTFVMVCSRRPLDLSSLEETGDWPGTPFASMETLPGQPEPKMSGQMSAVLALSEGKILTDDFAPVDNLLVPVFNSQE
jgi:predicted membrane-bound spermidine synthase